MRTGRIAAALALVTATAAAAQEPLPAHDHESVAHGPPVTRVSAEPLIEQRYYADAEYLLWWSRAAATPVPFITSGPPQFRSADGRVGVPGQPGTYVLLGLGNQTFSPQSGARFTFGYFFDDSRTCAVEGSYLFLGQADAHATVRSSAQNGSPPLSLPFYDVLLGQLNATGIAVSDPPGFSGVARVDTTTYTQSGELNLTNLFWEPQRLRLSLIGGFRYFNLDETLQFTTSSTNNAPLPRDVFVTTDRFDTSNDFYGGQVGFRAELAVMRCFINGNMKCAFGNVHQTSRINGSLVTNDFTNYTNLQTFPAGYFAQPTNTGVFERDRFAVVPEFNVNFGYQLTQALRLWVGYNVLYISSVARPGNNIDFTINPAQAPGITGQPTTALNAGGAVRPTFLGANTDFWAQGLNLGVEWRF